MYNDIILRELEDLPGILLSGCNHNGICYADKSLFMTCSEENLKELLE